MAKNFGIRFEIVSDLRRCTNELWRLWSPVFAGAPPDVTEENLQSRLRGVTLMALSNKTGALRADHRKQERIGRRLLHAVRRHVRGTGRDQRRAEDAGLSLIARGQSSGTTTPYRRMSSSSRHPRNCGRTRRTPIRLPEYDVLDQILKAYVEERRVPASRSRTRCGCRIALVSDIINKVDRNEYKRQQAAPGLKVTTKAFGIGRRFPIAQRFTE